MTTKLNVSQAAALYKKSRNTLYQAIQKGILSKDQDGLIDLSELIRVYGEPKNNTKNIKPTLTQERSEQSQDNSNAQLLAILKRENELLRHQLDEARERELFQRELIQNMNQKFLPLIASLNVTQDVPEEQMSTRTESIDSRGIEQNSEQGEQSVDQFKGTVEDTKRIDKKKSNFWSRLFN